MNHVVSQREQSFELAFSFSCDTLCFVFRLSVFAPSPKPKITPCLWARLSFKHGPYLAASELWAAGVAVEIGVYGAMGSVFCLSRRLGRWTRREARGVFWACARGDLRSRGKLRAGYVCYFCRATTRTRRTRTGPAPTDFLGPLASSKTASKLVAILRALH